ncbi:MAG: 3-oxoacyl-ACP reductase, partial [Solirubrobacteraceae bacterium]
MSDRYQQLVNTPIGKVVSKQIGLPSPVKLERYERGQPVIGGPVLLGAAPGSRLAGAIAQVLAAIEADVHTPMQDEVRAGAADAHLDAKVWGPDAAPEEQTFKALVFDATGIADSAQLHELWAFFHPTIRRVRQSGRVIVLGTTPADCKRPRQATAQRALEGFVRSIGKEVRNGGTAQLIYVGAKAESQIESTLRFCLSPKSAYASGQVVRIGATTVNADAIDWELPLAGRFALVTGAARGIGRAIAKVLARDGAHVVGLDVPGLKSELEGTIGELGGSTLVVDITDDDAPARIATQLFEEHGGVDVVVHNAGVTRDKTLGRMDEDRWNTVLGINLGAQERIDDELLAREVIRENGRIVSVSSMSGIAGNAGQTNYAASKAGVIGLIESSAPALTARG